MVMSCLHTTMMMYRLSTIVGCDGRIHNINIPGLTTYRGPLYTDIQVGKGARGVHLPHLENDVAVAGDYRKINPQMNT